MRGNPGGDFALQTKQFKVSKKHNYSKKTKQQHKSSFKAIRRRVSFMSLLGTDTTLDRFSGSSERHGLSTTANFFFCPRARAASETEFPSANHIASLHLEY